MHMQEGGWVKVAQEILFLAFPIFSAFDFATYMFPHHNFLFYYGGMTWIYILLTEEVWLEM